MQVGVDIACDVVLPVDEQLRALPGVGGEEAGEAARDGVAAALAQLLFLAGFEMAEVRGKRLAPVVAATGVDDVEQRPHHGVGGPRIVTVDAADLGDQRARVAEGDACADAVRAGAAAQEVAQPLTQPALDALGGDDDDLFGERIVQRVGEQGTQAVGEKVGAFSAVKVQAHRGPP